MAYGKDYKNQLPNSMMGGSLAGSQQLEPASPFDRLNDAVEALDGDSRIASTLADRLVGSQPEGGAGSAMPLPPCDGLLGSLSQKTNAIREIMESIEASLSRIDRRI